MIRKVDVGSVFGTAQRTSYEYMKLLNEKTNGNFKTLVIDDKDGLHSLSFANHGSKVVMYEPDKVYINGGIIDDINIKPITNRKYFKENKSKIEIRNTNFYESKVEALVIKADVSNETEVKNMISEIINKFHKIDVLVNNAGIVYYRNFDEITIDEFKRTLEVNVIGAFIVSRETSKYMGKGSSIVNVSSTNGTKTISPECLDYNISKIGLQSLTRDLAFQFKPNIRVNAIAIGWADTDMNKDLPKEYIEEETNKIYLERFANPSEIAKTIYFLASDESGYINSEIITIDGGYC